MAIPHQRVFFGSLVQPQNGFYNNKKTILNTLTIKGGARQLEKSHHVWIMMMIVASLKWTGAPEKSERNDIIKLTKLIEMTILFF